MRRLLIDLGNTRLKWRLQDERSGLAEGALVHVDASFDAGLEVLAATSAGARVWLASVAPVAITEQVLARLHAALAEPPMRVTVQPDFAGLRLAYAKPGRLGVDRWLGMLAALQAENRPRVIALAGTALTLDAVDAGGRHLGGLIVPGLALQRGTLTEGPLFLAESADFPPTMFCDDTGSAVSSGPAMALAALIDSFADAVRERCGAPPTVFLSGGDALRLQPLLGTAPRLREQLVLDGLACVAEIQSREAT